MQTSPVDRKLLLNLPLDQFKVLAGAFAEANGKIKEHERQVALVADSVETSKQTVSLVAFRKHVAAHMRKVAPDLRSKERMAALAVGDVDYRGPDVQPVVALYDEVLAEENDRQAAGERFWDYHGINAFECMRDTYAHFNIPVGSGQRGWQLAEAVATSLAGGEGWR